MPLNVIFTLKTDRPQGLGKFGGSLLTIELNEYGMSITDESRSDRIPRTILERAYTIGGFSYRPEHASRWGSYVADKLEELSEVELQETKDEFLQFINKNAVLKHHNQSEQLQVRKGALLDIVLYSPEDAEGQRRMYTILRGKIKDITAEVTNYRPDVLRSPI